MSEHIDNVRAVLGELIGQRVLDITQHDNEDFTPGGPSQVLFHFESGITVRFWIRDDGFDILDPEEHDAR